MTDGYAGIVQRGGNSQSQTHGPAWLKASDVELGVILNGVDKFQPISQVEDAIGVKTCMSAVIEKPCCRVRQIKI